VKFKLALHSYCHHKLTLSLHVNSHWKIGNNLRIECERGVGRE